LHKTIIWAGSCPRWQVKDMELCQPDHPQNARYPKYVSPAKYAREQNSRQEHDMECFYHHRCKGTGSHPLKITPPPAPPALPSPPAALPGRPPLPPPFRPDEMCPGHANIKRSSSACHEPEPKAAPKPKPQPKAAPPKRAPKHAPKGPYQGATMAPYPTGPWGKRNVGKPPGTGQGGGMRRD
jgi:hypothetical protein